MTAAITIRNMTRTEVDALVGWAANEGWNPGLHDAEVFWATDPEAYIAADINGELIGGGAITSYGGDYGFMGFFIVRPEFRGRGVGDALWHARLDRLRARLKPGASIGMDGVFDMQPYYAKGGFKFSHRNMRFHGDIPSGVQPPKSADIVSLADIPFDAVAAYDRKCFPAARDSFLRGWIGLGDAQALGFVDGGVLKGYGVVRRCGEGCKIGPLFADNLEVAEALYLQLSSFGAGGPVFLDAPENNSDAMALVARHNMTEVFGCARMYHGPVPPVDEARVFGVTTFELG